MRPTLPYIGMDALGVGLRGMKFADLAIVYAFDIASELLPASIARYRLAPADRFCIGPGSRNLLQVDVTRWKRVDWQGHLALRLAPLAMSSVTALQLTRGNVWFGK